MKQFNVKAVKARFERVASQYDQHAHIAADVAARLISRLDFVKLTPNFCVDLGCGTGFVTAQLKQCYPDAKITGVDFSSHMLQLYQSKQRCASQLASAEVLPFPDNSVDIIISNLLLPWSNDPRLIFSEAFRVLKPQGVLLFSSFGPDTFDLLRYAWAQVDQKPHVHLFLDMHDVGDLLLRSGFHDPVMDVERVTVKYKTLQAMLAEIKGAGMSNLMADRFKGLTGKKRWRAFVKALQGHLSLTLELVFAYAIKQDDVPKNAPDEQTFSLEALRNTLRHR